MSNSENDRLLDKAAELLEEISNHPSGFDKKLSEAILSGDLEEVHYWVHKINGELSQEHFHNWDLLGVENEY